MNILIKASKWYKDNMWKCSQIKKMVIVQFIFSVLLYSILITNQLTNHYDGLWSGNYALSGTWELSIGRWFWLYIDRLRIGISSEPLTSCLALFLIIIGNILIFDIFGQIGKKTGYLAGMIIMSSTTVCNYLSYRYMSPTFGASFLLSILAAWILVKKQNRVGNMVSAMVIALGLGAYQANLACTCVILVITFIKMVIEDEENKRIIHFTLGSFLTLATGCIIYKLIWQFHLSVFGVTPSSYNGADNISVSDMIICFPQNIIKSYKFFINYFFENSIKHNIFQKAGFYYLVCGIVIIALVTKIIMLVRKDIVKTVLLILASSVIPMACNISLFLATKAGVMIQMTAGMAILFPVILCLVNSIKEQDLHKNKFEKFKMAYIVFLAIILYGNVYMTAIDQETMYEGRNSSETLVHEAVSELCRKQMVSADKSYLFIGCPSRNPMFRVTKFWDMSNSYARYGEFWSDPGCLRMAYSGILRNIGVNLAYVPDDASIALNNREDVKNMPLFPAEGSIQEIDGYIVIKISNI